MRNGSEGDVDCGGSCAATCEAGRTCGAAADCASGVCTDGLCQAPTCQDLVRNGDETDLDCGGSCPQACATNQACGVDGDCASGVCDANVCAAATCEDGVLNGGEEQVDCGGDCAACVSPLRCTFSTAGGGAGTCELATAAFSQTDTDNVTIIGGQHEFLSLAASGIGYANGQLSFNATLQNLLAQSLGTIDGVTADPEGVRLVFVGATVTAGSGSITVANADGTGDFLAPGQPWFGFPGILAPNAVTAPRIVQLSVPPTVDTFVAEFLVSTKAQAKLVINEVLANPGGTISDASGEWFEVYNAGLFPVNMEGFRIGDSAASGDRPLHLLPNVLVIEPDDYLVFGTNADTTINGGVPVDYAYGTVINLANSLDVLRLVSPAGYISDQSVCSYTDPVCFQTFHVEIDRARYRTMPGNGVSWELRNPALDNMEIDGINWIDASPTSVYGPGGNGTPGARNSAFTP